MEHTIKNYTRSRAFGFGWSTHPTGRGTEIEASAAPDYTGTINHILNGLEKDRTYQSVISGGAFTNRCWFYKGKRITQTWGYGMVKEGSHDSRGYDDPKYNPNMYWDTAEYGYAWFYGFHTDMADENGTLKIKTA